MQKLVILKSAQKFKQLNILDIDGEVRMSIAKLLYTRLSLLQYNG